MTHLALRPGLLEEATPGNRRQVGRVYLTAAAWLGDGWLAERITDIGAVLRDMHYKKPADAVWRYARIQEGGCKLDRPATAQRYREAAAGLADGAAGAMPGDLAAWLAARLEAIADAIGDMDEAKPAGAIYRACGAGRPARRGNLPADADDEARDAALVWEVEYQRRLNPGVPLKSGREGSRSVFAIVAGLWSLPPDPRHRLLPVSLEVVEAAWKRRRTFRN